MRRGYKERYRWKVWCLTYQIPFVVPGPSPFFGGWACTDSRTTGVRIMVRKFANKEHSYTRAQLDSRISVVMKFVRCRGAHENTCVMVKGVITDLINLLQVKASLEANHKSCSLRRGCTRRTCRSTCCHPRQVAPTRLQSVLQSTSVQR